MEALGYSLTSIFSPSTKVKLATFAFFKLDGDETSVKSALMPAVSLNELLTVKAS